MPRLVLVLLSCFERDYVSVLKIELICIQVLSGQVETSGDFLIEELLVDTYKFSDCMRRFIIRYEYEIILDIVVLVFFLCKSVIELHKNILLQILICAQLLCSIC